MSQELLNQASASLVIDKILLASSRFTVSDDFLLDSDIDVIGETYNGTSSLSLVEFNDHNKYDRFLYRYKYSAGLRLLNTEASEDNEPQVLLNIEADFEARYYSRKKISDDCLIAFGDLNVEYHIWPYWREFVQSTLQRSEIKNIAVPLNTNKQSRSEQPLESSNN